ncbi:DUF1214 domain-containing protein [Vulgatibacter sp.]|uniref:DUF1214 domain-containing protein n=1 Tax=Vulgatibacter sp. TaxID=1971226 RepID=UPI00356664C1
MEPREGMSSTPLHEQVAGGTERVRLFELAVDAAIWGTPLVSFDAMREATRRDAGARFGDVLFVSRPADWRFQFSTPNATTYYVSAFLELQEGPAVLEVPPAAGAGLFGSILDAWQLPLEDVGPAGADEGRGARYLLLPPGYEEEVPGGYLPVRFDTLNGYVALRAIPEDDSQAAVERALALALARRLRIYPLARAAAPPPSRMIDVWGKPFDGLVRFDLRFFESLARMVEEEPPLPREAAMLERLQDLGIARGRPFAPDEATKQLLTEAAEQVHGELIRDAACLGQPFWVEARWREVFAGVHPETGFVFAEGGAPDLRQRATFFYFVIAPPKRPGKATVYLGGFFDAEGQPLDGGATYRLHVPAGVPASQFWAVTAYAADTGGFIRDAQVVELGSLDPVQKNPDGSVDLYFGAEAPAGREANWISTMPGEAWFTLFRFYGPQPALFDKSWRMGDFERLPGGALH